MINDISSYLLEYQENMSQQEFEEANEKEGYPSENIEIQKWMEFSMTPRTEDEIRQAILSEKRPGDDVCVSYICRYSTLSEDFIEELSYLTYSGKKKPDDFNPKIWNSDGQDRLDWVYLAQYQKLNEKFLLKHCKDICLKIIEKYQDCSTDFLFKHGYKFIQGKIEYKAREIPKI